MNFIQEVLNLLDRKQDKKELQLKRDYFEFGRTKPSSVGNPLYSPKMTPHAIRYDDLKCNIISGLVSGTGTEHTLPVFSTTDPANCDVQTIIDSVFAQSSDATLGIVNANLLVKGDTEIEGDLLVRGKQTIIESTIVEIADNIIELNTQGANVDAGFAVGTVTGLKTFGWDATNLLWNTFKESLMTKDIIINRNLMMDNEEINLITNSVEGLAAEPFDYAIPTTLAVIKYVDENIGGSDYKIVAPDSGLSNFGIIGLTKDGVDDSGIKVLGDQWIKTSSNGNELQIIHATPVIPTSTANLELTNGSVFVVRNHKYDAAGHIVVEEEIEYKLALTGLVPVMTSTVTGTGKLWDDTVQVQDAQPVSAEALRTYGVQFNDASQLVVNVPWVEGSGGSIVIGNPGSPTEDLTSISIDGTVYGIASGGGGSVISVGLAAPSAFTVTNSPVTTSGVLTLTGAGATTDYIDGTGALQEFPSIPSVPANIVETVDTQNGTYIDMTPTGAVDGDVVVTAELSAVDGADTSGRFLSKDNVWSAIPGGNAGTVTSVGLSTDIAAFTVGSSPVTDNGVIELNRNGGTAGQFLRQDGNWADIPSGGTVTTVSTEVTPVLADSIDFTVADPTTTPKLTIDFKGAAGQYISGEGKLETFPTVGSMSSWTIKDGTALGPVLDQAEVQFVGDDKITTKLTDNAGNYILSIDHDDTERIDQTNQLSPAFGDTFKIVDSITQDDQGHPTEVTFLELTLPTPDVGATEAFKTIKVDNAPTSNIPGQADVIADSAADTVGYKGGRQIAITTDPTNDIITWDYLRTFIGGGGLIEDVDGALGMEEITITETTSTKKLGKAGTFDVEDVTYNNKGQAIGRETTKYELDIQGGGTTNCTFGTTFDNTLIAINGAGSYGLPRPIIAQGGTEFGFRNTSGEPRNYAITYTLEIQGAAGANFYRFETGLAASDTPNNTKIQLINFQEQVYANAESNFSVTFTYYAAGLADQEYIVATINEISALVSCPKAYIAGGSMTVVSSSCDGITDSTMGIIVDRP
jgi:hypothetical protein